MLYGCLHVFLCVSLWCLFFFSLFAGTGLWQSWKSQTNFRSGFPINRENEWRRSCTEGPCTHSYRWWCADCHIIFVILFTDLPIRVLLVFFFPNARVEYLTHTRKIRANNKNSDTCYVCIDTGLKVLQHGARSLTFDCDWGEKSMHTQKNL